MGVSFDHAPGGDLDYTREGAHSRPRILHHADLTGAEITLRLLEQACRLPNVTIYEHVTMDDLVVEKSECLGVRARLADGGRVTLLARDTILATGGIGGTYERSTNYACLTGDGCRVAEAPYNPQQFVLTIDGFIVSDNVRVISTQVDDTGFAYSDHNPVEVVFELIGK